MGKSLETCQVCAQTDFYRVYMSPYMKTRIMKSNGSPEIRAGYQQIRFISETFHSLSIHLCGLLGLLPHHCQLQYVHSLCASLIPSLTTGMWLAFCYRVILIILNIFSLQNSEILLIFWKITCLQQLSEYVYFQRMVTGQMNECGLNDSFDW